MKIVIIADDNFKEMADGAKRTAESFGYDVIIYKPEELTEKLNNGLTIGDITYTPKSQWKPYMLRKIFDEINEDFVYMDADTLIIHSIEEAFNEKFDVGLTAKRGYERNLDDFGHISGWVNAGVIFVRNTDGAKRFLDYWVKEMPNTDSGSDQEALTTLFKDPPKGILVHKFKTDEYNYYYFDEPIPNKTKILHFKGNYKKLWKIFVKEKN